MRHQTIFKPFFLLPIALLLTACGPSLEQFDVMNFEMEPSFQQQIKNYSLTVPSSQNSISLSIVASADSSSLELYSDKFLLSGYQHEEIPLRHGYNDLTAYVTNELREVRYNVRVFREYELNSQIGDAQQEILEEYFQFYNQNELSIVGISAAVSFGRGPTWIGATGYEHLDKKTPLDPSQLMGPGSITKTFVAALALKLIDEGYNFTLEDTIEDWIPAINRSSKINPNISMRQLLSHQSGLIDEISSMDSLLEVIQSNANINVLAYLLGPKAIVKNYATSPTQDPGVKFQYANINYTIAGIMLTRVLKSVNHEDSFSKALRRYFLKPLNLSSTYFAGEEYVGKNLAKGHVDLGAGHIVNYIWPDFHVLRISNFPGSIASTPEDLSRWAEALWGYNQSGSEILSDESLREMLTSNNQYGLGTQFFNIDIDIGTGLDIDVEFVGHTGSEIIYSGLLLHNRDTGGTIAITINNDETSTILLEVASDLAGSIW